MENKGRVTGLGGIFFKTTDPDKTKKWYYDNLKLVPNEYGSLFEFREGSNPDQIGYSQWGPFKSDTDYFEPSKKEFMINFRVAHIEDLVEELRASGIEITMEIETYEYGKFAHIIDPEGIKIELWEPVDEAFTKLYDGKTTM
jgi:predicted enzyme related to lactoylglutathione lyase